MKFFYINKYNLKSFKQFQNNLKNSDDLSLTDFINKRNPLKIKGATAVIDIHGELGFNEIPLFEKLGGTDYKTVANEIDQINFEEIDTVIFTIRTPGGSVEGLSEIADKIRRIPCRTIAYCEGAFSAGVYIAVSCDAVISTESSEFGSIGTVCVIDNSDDDDLIFITNNDAEYKAMPRPLSDEHIAYLQEKCDYYANQFKEWIIENRGNDVDDKSFSGKTFNAKDAKDMNLIDEIINWTDKEEIFNK